MKLSDTLLRQDGLSMARDGTTYCGTRGEYTFLLLTTGNELIVSVLRGGENPEKDDFRDFVKARPELSGCKTAGTRVTFSLRPGATAKSCAEKIHTLLPELLLFLHENGYENCCEISRAVGATVGCMTGGVPRLIAPMLFTELSRKAEQNERVQAEAPEDIGRGILGALIGGLIGAAVIVLIGQLGYVAALSGMVLGYCTIGGYRRGAGKLSAIGIAVSVVVMLLAVYLGNRTDIAIAAVKELDLTFGQAFAWMHELVDTDAYRNKLITLYLFSAIGAVPAAFNAHKLAREKGRVYRIGE